MELYGLKALFLGDSITQGHGTSAPDKVFWHVLGKRTGMKTVGYGVGGTRIARQKHVSDCAVWDMDFNLRAEQMERDADIICIFGGTNDYGHGWAPIGQPDDRDVYTFYGALDHLFRYLLSTYPDAYIFVMTPTHRLYEEQPATTGDTPTMLPLKGYVDIIREVAGRYALPGLDLFAMSGINPSMPVLQERYMPDGLHPNDAGHEKLANIIETFLRANYHR